MKVVWIYKGLPASGKTTAALKEMEEHPGMYKRINKDDLRDILDGGKWSGSNEKFILHVRDYLIVKALTEGKHVIIDDTNLNPIHEERIRNLVKEYSSSENDVIVRTKDFFEVSVEECIKRDLKRQNSVGEKVIKDMYSKWLAPKIEVTPLKQDSLLPHAIIVDIDGTIALKGDRDPFDWNKVKEDKPNWAVIKMVSSYKDMGRKIFFVSGRDEICRKDTEDWIYNYVTTDVDTIKICELLMRPPNDSRKDSILKKEMYDTNIKGRYYIEAVFDDRLQTCQMWYKEGLPLFRVGDPDATF